MKKEKFMRFMKISLKKSYLYSNIKTNHPKRSSRNFIKKYPISNVLKVKQKELNENKNWESDIIIT